MKVMFYDRDGEILDEQEKTMGSFWSQPYIQYFKGSALITSRVLSQTLDVEQKTLRVYTDHPSTPHQTDEV